MYIYDMKMTPEKQKEMLTVINDLFTSGQIAECYITTDMVEKHNKKTGNVSVIKTGFRISCEYANIKEL